MSILIIGNFGYKKNQLDGQTIKTRNIAQLTIEKSHQKVQCLDTSFKSNFFKLIWLIKPQTTIFFMGAKASFAFAFPIIFMFCKWHKCPIIYIHVGSFLYPFLNKWPFYKYFVENIKANFPETDQIKKDLDKIIKSKNMYVLPNVRLTKHKTIFRETGKTLKLVFMARIIKKKGVDLIFEMHKHLNEYFVNGQIELHFYGPILDAALRFDEKINTHFGIAYKGILQPQNIYATLEKYDALVFPSYFDQEGFPGTILDAYLAGIPVIASNWKYNAEMIVDQHDGLLFENKNALDLSNKIMSIATNIEFLHFLKKNAVQKASTYSPEKAWLIIAEHLD